MRLYCVSLPEDHRRRDAAVDALKIGRNTAARLLDDAGYRRRALRTELIMGQVILTSVLRIRRHRRLSPEYL